MAEDIAKLGIEITSEDVVKAIHRLDRLEEQSKQNEKANKRLGVSFGGLTSVITAFTGSLVVGKFIETAGAFESMQVSLETVTGSAEKASAAFQGIQAFAKNTPFQVREITDAFIKLKALGLQPSEASLTSFGNTASAMGKSLNQFIEAVADAATSEFERLKEFGIKASNQGDTVKFTFQGVTTTVKNSSEEITKYLQSIGETQFAGAMAKQMDTINGKLSNLSDATDRLFVTFANAGAQSGTKGALDTIIDAVNSITDGVSKLPSIFVAGIAQVDKFFATFTYGVKIAKEYIDIFQSGDEFQKNIKLINDEYDRQIRIADKSAQHFIDAEEKKREEMQKTASAQGIDVGGKAEKKATDTSNPFLIADKEAEAIAKKDKQEQDYVDRYLERIRTRNESEISLMEEKYLKEKDMLDTWREQGKIDKDAYDAAIDDIEYEHAEKRRAINQMEMDSKLNLAKNALGALEQLMSTGNKKQFEIAKKAALASAIINTYQAVASGLKTDPFFPVGIAMGAIALVAGLAQVKRIQSQQYNGGAAGGSTVPSVGAVSATGVTPTQSAAPPTGPNGQQTNARPPQELRVTLTGDAPGSEAMRNFTDNLAKTIDDMGGVSRLTVAA